MSLSRQTVSCFICGNALNVVLDETQKADLADHRSTLICGQDECREKADVYVRMQPPGKLGIYTTGRPEEDFLPRKLGSLVLNLLSIEVLLRACIAQAAVQTGGPDSEALKDLTTALVGQEYNANDIVAEWRGLRWVASQFTKLYPHIPMYEARLITLRDFLAHGRIIAADLQRPFRLIKFSKPYGEKVRVDFAADLTSEWIGEQIAFTADILMRVNTVHAKTAHLARSLQNQKDS